MRRIPRDLAQKFAFNWRDEPLLAVDPGETFEVETFDASNGYMDWLIADYGFSAVDAYCLVSTCPDFRINVYQMCRIRNLRPVAGAEIPKIYLLS